jgi:hypothetical protein
MGVPRRQDPLAYGGKESWKRTSLPAHASARKMDGLLSSKSSPGFSSPTSVGHLFPASVDDRKEWTSACAKPKTHHLAAFTLSSVSPDDTEKRRRRRRKDKDRHRTRTEVQHQRKHQEHGHEDEEEEEGVAAENAEGGEEEEEEEEEGLDWEPAGTADDAGRLQEGLRARESEWEERLQEQQRENDTRAALASQQERAEHLSGAEQVRCPNLPKPDNGWLAGWLVLPALFACVLACAFFACLFAYMLPCVLASLRPCVRACVRACVCAPSNR